MSVVILGSLVFYAYWKPLYAPLPFLLTIIAQAGAYWISATAVGRVRTTKLAFIISFLLIPLVFYKYTNFLFGIVAQLFHLENIRLVDYSLPLGISFITFTLIAYCVDIYRGRQAIQHNFSVLLASVLFFPHLIAGPIVRPNQLASQMNSLGRMAWRNTRFGLFLFAIGLFKKMVIADSIGGLVDEIYRNVLTGAEPQAQWMYVFAFYGFSFQIFCDFSAYSDMALGVARVLGVRLPQNFNSPYVATNLIEFWKRWHITLSRWLRDYLYIPLGGNRCGKFTQLRNILITMALGGLWHGASWTFLAWGGLHGIGICLNHLLLRLRVDPIPKVFKRLVIFHFVTAAWVLFRSPNLPVAGKIFAGMFASSAQYSGIASYLFPILALILAVVFHAFDRHAVFRWVNSRISRQLAIVLIFIFILLSVVIGAGSSQQFIYFEF